MVTANSVYIDEASYNAQAAAYQSHADAAYRVHQMSAPSRVVGEMIDPYRRRLLQPVQHLSETWRNVNLDRLPASALPVAETQIVADAVTAGTRNEGPLREVTEVDQSGRKISRFYGRPGACWDQFKGPVRQVIGWTTKF